jgi:NADH-quinone oxidoreductase subunit C/D
MDDFYQSIFGRLNNRVKGFVALEERPEHTDEQTLLLEKEAILDVMKILKDEFHFSFLMDVCGVDWPERSKRFDVVYHLHNPKDNKRLRVKTQVGEGEGVESLVSLWQSANWFERETYDMFGVLFTHHPQLERLLTHKDFVGHPLRKDYPADYNQSLVHESLEHTLEKDRERLMKAYDDEDLMFINIGPAHPATHGTLRFMSVIDGGEKIYDMDVEIGYLHRCFEKMCESHNYNQIIPYTDRLNYCSAPMNNNAFCETIEKLLGIQVPPRAQMLRMIIDEFSRIMDHYVCIGANLVDLGAISGFFFLFEERESIYALFEKLCGARLTVSMMRIGGMGFDIPDGWLDECLRVVKKIEAKHAEIDKLVSTNRIFIQRTKGAGPISKEDAVSFGFTGPCLRATGFEMDLRKESPYWFYKDVEFDVPVGNTGDTYDRYLVRMEEVRESLKIIRWCLKNLPSGPIRVSDKTISLPDKKDVYGNIEGLMNHFMLIIHGVKPPKGEVYHKTEGANGELGFYVISDGTGVPYRVKCRPPCFPILSAFPHMAKGGLLADAVSTLGSLNIIAGELDR